MNLTILVGNWISFSNNKNDSHWTRWVFGVIAFLRPYQSLGFMSDVKKMIFSAALAQLSATPFPSFQWWALCYQPTFNFQSKIANVHKVFPYHGISNVSNTRNTPSAINSFYFHVFRFRFYSLERLIFNGFLLWSCVFQGHNCFQLFNVVSGAHFEAFEPASLYTVENGTPSCFRAVVRLLSKARHLMTFDAVFISILWCYHASAYHIDIACCLSSWCYLANKRSRIWTLSVLVTMDHL